MRKLRNGVQSSSAKAVGVAGLRERRAPSDSAHSWTPRKGKLPEDETFRPGKTERSGGRRRSS